TILENCVPFEQEIYDYLLEQKSEGLTKIQKAFNLNRIVAVNALNALEEKGLVSQKNRLYTIEEPN
ncbi:MAG: gas vesicle protein GvpN, partial [Stigonema ocellatum SAG 48.90 = DSM 106950]|nr:gas vesicle protein GvpN [Stigonema ocellatum SAG 48.90 = DSM 106950]